MERIELGEMDYTVGICPEYLDTPLPAGLFTYYEIELSEDYDIGTEVFFRRGNWRIAQKQAELKAGVLVFQYRLRIADSILTKKMHQPLFTGRSILGTVLATEGEHITLHLDMDAKQEEQEAYAYEWSPDTGSVMYCMPKVGTKASLYFPSMDEQMARVVSCVRENGGSCPHMTDPSKRGLTTEHGKELFLNPADMGVKSESNQLCLVDGEGISLAAVKEISITTEKQIKLVGKEVRFETPKEIQMARG